MIAISVAHSIKTNLSQSSKRTAPAPSLPSASKSSRKTQPPTRWPRPTRSEPIVNLLRSMKINKRRSYPKCSPWIPSRDPIQSLTFPLTIPPRPAMPSFLQFPLLPQPQSRTNSWHRSQRTKTISEKCLPIRAIWNLRMPRSCLRWSAIWSDSIRNGRRIRIRNKVIGRARWTSE